MSEDDFYDSDYWADERERALEDWNGCCEICGCITRSPHVHHCFGLNANVYQVLCPECHAEIHNDPEIAEYQKKDPKCRICGKKCFWSKKNKRWVLMDSFNKIHICAHEKEKLIEISRAIKSAVKKREPKQRKLF